MFTGIVTDLGTIRKIETAGDTRFDITTGYDLATIALGASIACSGVCLTVIETGADWFAVQASGETLTVTTLGKVAQGDRLNLERALCVGDELGGHLVSGHVDGKAKLISAIPDGDSWRMRFCAPEALKKYIAPKGSVTLDGISLTVNEVQDREFGINVIPHTWQMTTLGFRKPGDELNLEIDMLARYVERMMKGD